MEDKSLASRPSGLTLVFTPIVKKAQRDCLNLELVSQLNLGDDKDIIYVVSSDSLCNDSESPAEILVSCQQPHEDLTPSKASLGCPQALHSCRSDKTEAVCEALVGLCRQAGLLAPRATLLSLKEQQQALLLCLARHNKEVSGDFSADASDLLAAWNIMKKGAFEVSGTEGGRPNSSKSKTPVAASGDVRALLESYASFIAACSSIDVFTLHRALCVLGAEQGVASKVVVVEGAVSELEQLLLQPLLKACSCVYIAAFITPENDSCSDAGVHSSKDASWLLRHVDTEEVTLAEIFRACCGTVSNAATPAAKASLGGSPHGTPITPALKQRALGSTAPSCTPCRTSRPKGHGRESLLYVGQVMVCQIRLLLNTRDEMALAVNCSLPGTAMSPAAFATIKQEARRINMPMFQTVVSVVQKRRLGGNGYQLASDSAVLTHVTHLTHFVEHINALSTVVEDVPCVRTAASQILAKIKRYVVKQCTGVHAQKCPIKVSTIEEVYKGLQNRLDQCLRRFDAQNNKPISTGSVNSKPGPARAKLPYPVLSLLQRLCDRCTSERSFGDDSVASFMSLCGGDGEVVMSQGGGSPAAFTPVRVPSVLSLFHTPPAAADLPGEDGDVDLGLRVRLMKSHHATPVRSKRHVSCMAWAPDNLSPIQVLESPEVKSPVRPSSQQVLAAIAELPDRSRVVSTAGSPKSSMNQQKRKTIKRSREALPVRKRSLLNDISQLEACDDSKDGDGGKEKLVSAQTGSGVSQPKRSSKRSLLSDISNLAPSLEGSKKSKTGIYRLPGGKKTIEKALPKGQKSIASFFVMKSK